MTETKATNVFWHTGTITRSDREKKHGHRGCIIWLTGLSGSGKSTIAHRLEEVLHGRGISSYVLDGDNIRHGLNKNLGFSPADREENIRRIGEVAKIFVDAGIIAITAFISPYRKDRDQVRANVNPAVPGASPGDFIECYVKCSVEACEKRDTKGLYAKARSGAVKEFTGISAPYEEPLKPEIILETEGEDVNASAARIIAYLEKQKYAG